MIKCPDYEERAHELGRTTRKPYLPSMQYMVAIYCPSKSRNVQCLAM